MSDSHDRFDEQAVGHVLGGLDPAEAATFRTHLLDCRDCRARVSELRALASDLEVAAREERAAARLLQVDTERRTAEEEDDDEPGSVDRRRRWMVVAGAAMLVVLGVLAVWNQALRLDNATLAGTTAVREDVLATLGDGTALEVETRAGVTGVAAIAESDGAVALSLGNLGELAEMNRVVVWRDEGVGAEAWEQVMAVTAERIVNERLALVVGITDRTGEIVVTVEQPLVPDEPNDFPVFRVTIP